MEIDKSKVKCDVGGWERVHQINHGRSIAIVAEKSARQTLQDTRKYYRAEFKRRTGYPSYWTVKNRLQMNEMPSVIVSDWPISKSQCGDTILDAVIFPPLSTINAVRNC